MLMQTAARLPRAMAQRMARCASVAAASAIVAASSAVRRSSSSTSLLCPRRLLPALLFPRRGLASNSRGNRGTIATASIVVDTSRSAASSSRSASSSTAGSSSDSSSVPYLRASSTTISDVLSVYQADGRTFTCSASASLYDAVRIMVSSRVGCLVAMEEDGEHVAGLVTERDILSEMVRLQDGADETSSNWSTTTVATAMTRSREMVHIRPGDLIDDALKLMTSQGFRHLPVLESTPEGNHLRGMVSMRNLVDVIYKHKDAGGKAQFLYDILPRTGVPKNTALRKKGAAPGANAAAAGSGAAKDADAPYPSLFLNAGICAIPHPDKKAGEDSYVAVVANVNVNQEAAGAGAAAGSAAAASSSSSSSSSPALLRRPFSVLAVFDGVGSWSFEQGLDPAKFSNACAEGLKAYIDAHPTLSPSTNAVDHASASLLQSAPAPLSPSCMLSAVWDFVCQRRVVGSSTACILALAHHSNELRATNIGDSGFLVLRHRDAQRQLHMGSVGATTGAQASGAPDYQVVYRSPQQLHYFNCPLQIGIDVTGALDKFESPVDADILSVPLQDGDLVVLATDGLFDNVPEEAIVAEVGSSMAKIAEAEAAESTPPAPMQASTTSGTADRPAVHTGPVSPLTPVATALGQLAYRLSLDKMTDSPFALLAKDNNIMWKNGGRKDDITVIVARVDTIPTAQARA